MSKAGALLLALAIAAGCSGSPAAPPPFALVQQGPSIAGLWRGQFEFLSCTGDTAECDGPAVRDFWLSLGQARTEVVGNLVLDDRYGTAVSVSGRQDADGVYHLEAPRFHVAGSSASIRDVTVESLTIRETADGLEGSFTYMVTGAGTPLFYRRTAFIRTATHEPAAADSHRRFDGAWSGYYINRACHSNDGFFCQTGLAELDQVDGGAISMSLARSGDQITGEIMGLPVTGSVRDIQMHVETQPLTEEACPVCPDCVGVCQMAIGMSARVDKLGRMEGEFNMSRKGWNGERHFLTRTLGRLSSVVRVRR